jgi:hypothetical protein
VEWADSVLGTDSYDHGVPGHSLHTEVDAYFLDTVTTSYTSVMTYWQVSTQLTMVVIIINISAFTYSFVGEPVSLSHNFYACGGCVGHPRLFGTL